MLSNLNHRPDPGPEPMFPREAHLVLASARSLQHAAESGAVLPLLRGKNLALISESQDDPDALLFAQAAAELGANVAHIQPSRSKLASLSEVRDTARMLGRLYDAVACNGVAPDVVQQIGTDAGVPVFDGLASTSHPTAALAEQLGSQGTPQERRRYVLQAVLVATLG